MAKENTNSAEEETRMVNTQKKRCSASLVIKKRQIKITVRFYFTSSSMKTKNKTKNLGINK